ncbi:MAG: hypothetical protein WBQ21_13600 [Solirubrobacteraceae bacterium]
MLENAGKRNLPSGTLEIVPLVIGIVGISIPVILVALAATGKSTVVLVLALLAMLVVGAATLWFILVLTDDSSEQHDGGAHGESPTTPQS